MKRRSTICTPWAIFSPWFRQRRPEPVARFALVADTQLSRHGDTLQFAGGAFRNLFQEDNPSRNLERGQPRTDKLSQGLLVGFSAIVQDNGRGHILTKYFARHGKSHH